MAPLISIPVMQVRDLKTVGEASLSRIPRFIKNYIIFLRLACDAVKTVFQFFSETSYG